MHFMVHYSLERGAVSCGIKSRESVVAPLLSCLPGGGELSGKYQGQGEGEGLGDFSWGLSASRSAPGPRPPPLLHLPRPALRRLRTQALGGCGLGMRSPPGAAFLLGSGSGATLWPRAKAVCTGGPCGLRETRSGVSRVPLRFLRGTQGLKDGRGAGGSQRGWNRREAVGRGNPEPDSTT